jgi:hypothetical protein
LLLQEQQRNQELEQQLLATQVVTRLVDFINHFDFKLDLIHNSNYLVIFCLVKSADSKFICATFSQFIIYLFLVFFNNYFYICKNKLRQVEEADEQRLERAVSDEPCS